MLSRATWRDRENSSTRRSNSVLSLMQNWAAASLMVSCGEGAASLSEAQLLLYFLMQPCPVYVHGICLGSDTAWQLSPYSSPGMPPPTAPPHAWS